MNSFLDFALVGLFAQLEGSALGMGFGVVSSTVPPAQGVPPPPVSACVNAAKGPTGLASDFSHALHGNIDRRLFARLALAGIADRIVGVLILGKLKRSVVTVIIANSLLLIGALILWRTFAQRLPWLGATTCISAIGTTGDLAGMLKNEAGLF